MSDIKVKIKGVSYEMVFNLKLIRTLGRFWNLPDIPSTMGKVALIETISQGNLEAYDVMYDIMYHAILCNKENPVIDKDDIEDLSVDEFVKFAEQLTIGITASFPDAENTDDEEKKQIAPKRKNPKLGIS